MYRVSDGDTPVVEQPVRMVSCDTPEKAGYAGKPETSQPKLEKCRQRLVGEYYNGHLAAGLRDYLASRITPDAAQRHIGAGYDASREFERMLEERLALPDGKRRKTAVIPTGEIIDRYGRMLAYISPWFAGEKEGDPLPPKDDPRRKTFNLEMVETGWAASFPIYPSLPGNDDMNRLIAGAEDAWNGKKGMWAQYGKDLLLAYEYRMCIKLANAASPEEGVKEAFQRHCVDLAALKIVGKYDFYKVPPPYRLWVWEGDLEKARADLGLTA
ncbi:thermonuclease family protein [Nitrososphaera viennensis]|uniref:Thermonuclease family protein n=1 Tax=Nitrososphaera viennensis TaxID=1034015 RepID=A0A977IFK1_9ARCH|nr:thermonuclease family protein [Nitrososphaera viennensis]UVS69852.1 thermonuclease family protein [Nitrososphaera viennensis]